MFLGYFFALIKSLQCFETFHFCTRIGCVLIITTGLWKLEVAGPLSTWKTDSTSALFNSIFWNSTVFNSQPRSKCNSSTYTLKLILSCTFVSILTCKCTFTLGYIGISLSLTAALAQNQAITPASPPLLCHSQGTPLNSETVWTRNFRLMSVFLKMSKLRI